MTYQRTILAAVTGLTLVGTSQPSFATKPAPYHSFVRPVGEKYVFVMRTDDDNLRHFIEEYAVPQRQIHRKYKASGLYPVDDPANPLWTVDWVGRPEDLLVLKDGVHLVRYRSGALNLVSGSPPRVDHDTLLQSSAVEVFANGKPIWSRRVGEVVPYPELRPDERWYRSISADADAGQLEIQTRDGCTTVLDCRTGEIRSQTRPLESRLRNSLGVMLLVGGVPLGGLAFLMFRRYRSRTRTAGSVD